MALIVLDASVLIAHLDPADALHEPASEAVRGHVDDELRLPTSAYSEYLVDAARAGAIGQARESVERLGLILAPIDQEIAEEAARLRARSNALRLPDALVIACGEIFEADVVLTADRRWARFPRVRVVSAS